MNQTRRQMIKTLSSVLAGVGMSGEAWASQPPDTINMNKEQRGNRYQNMTREAYLALPGVCFTTLYSHLPQLLTHSSTQPVVLIDIYDFNRLQGRVVRERENQNVQTRGAITTALRRRGILRPIDYARYYPAESQHRHLHRYRAALESLPDHVNQQAASQTLDSYADFGRGDYQKPFRAALGNWDINIEKLQQLATHHRRIERGRGDPARFNKDIFAQYIAALEIRSRVNRHLDLNVVGVLGQGEQEGISTILRSAELEFDDDVLALSSGKQSIKQIGRPAPSQTAAYHDLFENVARTAREVTGTQHDDWYILGSRLAAPLLPDLFTQLNGLNGIHQDTDQIVAEVEQILEHLDKEASEHKPSHLTYEAERIAEEQNTSHQTDEIADQLGTAADLAHYSDDLREIADLEIFSPASVFVAASVKMDPNHRYNKDELYRRAITLQSRLAQGTVSDAEAEFFDNRGGFKRGGKGQDWYHTDNRQRRPTIAH